jgi:hypothetical protein
MEVAPGARVPAAHSYDPFKTGLHSTTPNFIPRTCLELTSKIVEWK